MKDAAKTSITLLNNGNSLAAALAMQTQSITRQLARAFMRAEVDMVLFISTYNILKTKLLN